MTQPLPLTYAELLCVDDVDMFDRTVGSDFEALQQDVYHRLLEAPGSNPDDQDLGIGVEGMLSGSLADLQKIPHRVESNLLKDPRITACVATVTQQPDGSFLLAIEVEVSSTTLGLAFAYSSGEGLQVAQ